MLRKMNRLALYMAVVAPLLISSNASAELTDAVSEPNSVNINDVITTETTAFDFSHAIKSKDTVIMPLNINTASQLELTALPGIGEYKAMQIVQWRDNHGEFITTTDLVNVKGIGEGTVRKLTGKIAVNDL